MSYMYVSAANEAYQIPVNHVYFCMSQNTKCPVLLPGPRRSLRRRWSLPEFEPRVGAERETKSHGRRGALKQSGNPFGKSPDAQRVQWFNFLFEALYQKHFWNMPKGA